MKKILWPVFSRSIEHDKQKEQFKSVQKVVSQVLCKLYDVFFRTYEVENQIFQKNAVFPVTKDFGLFFSNCRMQQTSKGYL